MKSLLLRTLQGIAAGAVLLAFPLCAGMLDHTLTLQIPFDFMAGRHAFPAGAYTVKSDVISGTVLVHNDEKGPAAFLITHSGGEYNNSGRAKLVFHQYGDSYFLSQVWVPGSSVRRLNQSPKEAELAKRGARREVLAFVASALRSPR